MLPRLATARLGLDPAVPSDLDEVWRLLVDPDVRRFLCDDRVMPRAAVADILAECIAGAESGLGMWIARRDGAVAGIAVLKPVPRVLVDLVPMLDAEVEPTIALHPAQWGQGLAGEALGAVLEHGFGTLGLARIAAVCDVPNLASARMLARAGFVPTGEHPGLHYRIRTWTLARG